MLPLENLFPHIEQLLKQKERIVVAIDGMSAAGKSSLAVLLAKQAAGSIQRAFKSGSCNLIHMDHFFLRPEQRTPERLNMPGGNIDYERFIEEAAKPLASGAAFSYRPFNCKTQDFDELIAALPKPLTIVEGVYSMHPEIAEACLYDINIFMQIDEATQRQRLKERSPQLYERFINEWIPMESKYFETYNIVNKCNYVIDNLIGVQDYGSTENE